MSRNKFQINIFALQLLPEFMNYDKEDNFDDYRNLIDEGEDQEDSEEEEIPNAPRNTILYYIEQLIANSKLYFALRKRCYQR